MCSGASVAVPHHQKQGGRMQQGHGLHVIGIAGALVAGLLAVSAAQAADKPKPASSCVACHTDKTKLQEEAKGIPIPAGSVLQAGKG